MERLSGILNQTSSNSGYGADFEWWGWSNVATKGAVAHPCLHIQTGFPLKGGIVFLSTSYRDNWSLILPSGLKTTVLWAFQKISWMAGGCRSHSSSHVPTKSASSPSEGQTHSWTNCTQALSSAKCFWWPICEAKNKLCKQIWQRNPQSKHSREIAASSQIFGGHLVRAISSNKINVNEIILAVHFWIQSSLNWKLKSKNRFVPTVFCRLTWDGIFLFTYMGVESANQPDTF